MTTRNGNGNQVPGWGRVRATGDGPEALEPGRRVRIVDGHLAGMEGTVEESFLEGGRVKVLLTIYGKQALVTVEIRQVEPV